METKRFFDELAPRLETARVLDRELDRNLARKFNVLDYLRTNELGLSRIIADLLDPKGSHGQGVLFLQAFLEKLGGFRETLRWPDLHGTEVCCEEKITEGRIDVVVRIEGPGGETHCLVLENKPYAHDQESQVERYLEHFGKDDRFLLIYLSPRGEGPSEVSVPKDKLREWRDHFAIMPYVGAHEEQEEQGDGFDEYRLSHSLANWLGECRRDCEVEGQPAGRECRPCAGRGLRRLGARRSTRRCSSTPTVRRCARVPRRRGGCRGRGGRVLPGLTTRGRGPRSRLRRGRATAPTPRRQGR